MEQKQKRERIHLVGIKGVAMSALAVYLKESGMDVTGSDVSEHFPTDDMLSRAGISVYEGFDAAHVEKTPAPAYVYYTGAHSGRDNPEVVRAVALGIPVYAHGQALGRIMSSSKQMVAAGCHGKTTTSAMLAQIFQSAKADASYAIGAGGISSLGPAGHFGHGEWFIAEGDEYVTDPGHDATPRFLWTSPDVLVVTNIDFDHPDVYKDLSDVTNAYVSLAKKSKRIVVNADDPNSKVLLSLPSVVTFGTSPRADYQLTRMRIGKERQYATLCHRGQDIVQLTLVIPGRHNMMDAAAAAVAAHEAGISWDDISEGLRRFTGTKRRFEKLKDANGIVWYDDYAHHPKEIAATLSAARSWYPKRRIVAVFQPHTYSRTKHLLTEFAGAFTDADAVVCTDIYASAREHDTLGITGQTLVDALRKQKNDVEYVQDIATLGAFLTGYTKSGDVVIFMGAGDIYAHGRAILGIEV